MNPLDGQHVVNLGSLSLRIEDDVYTPSWFKQNWSLLVKTAPPVLCSSICIWTLDGKPHAMCTIILSVCAISNDHLHQSFTQVLKLLELICNIQLYNQDR